MLQRRVHTRLHSPASAVEVLQATSWGSMSCMQLLNLTVTCTHTYTLAPTYYVCIGVSENKGNHLKKDIKVINSQLQLHLHR